MTELHKTVLYDHHARLSGQIVKFGGWQMPLHYEPGIVQEHLSTRKTACLLMFRIKEKKLLFKSG